MNRSAVLWVVSAMVLGLGCQQLPVRSFDDRMNGTFDAETRYDMSTLAGMFGDLGGEWRQPDQMVYNQITSSVISRYGSTIGQGFIRIYGSTLQSEVTDYLSSETPAWVLQMGTRLDEVDAQLNTVDLQTSMLVTEAELGRVKSTQIWNGASFFKDPDCPDSGAITCDQFQLTSEELLDAEYPIEILSSDFTATRDRGTMTMESHSLDFNYGRLGLYLLVNQILPDSPSDGVGMRDLALGAINCRGLAGRLAGDSGTLGVDVGGTTVGLSLNDLVGDCETGVLATVNGFVDRFEVPVGMDLEGSAALVDTNRDGRIDQMTSGEVAGDMAADFVGGRSEEGPVSGQFVGFRVGDLP